MLVAGLLGVVACTATVQTRELGRRTELVFAPYVDVSLTPPGLLPALRDTPARRFVVAFLLARDGSCDPMWGGGRALDDPALMSELARVRSAGGAVTLASGGAVGDYLENECGSAQQLAEVYRKALALTGADRLELDAENQIPVETVADGLASVQRELGVPLTLTVGVADANRGLTPEFVPLLRALADRRLDVTVNAMVMNFPALTSWRDSLIAAADAVAGQLSQLWPHDEYRHLGLTLMAGRNDTDVITTVEDAEAVYRYALQHRISFLGLWSLARDNGACPGRRDAVATCSGIAQNRYDFIRTLTQGNA